MVDIFRCDFVIDIHTNKERCWIGFATLWGKGHSSMRDETHSGSC
jgi:hypothetical protein